jgi:hypothetical protein
VMMRFVDLVNQNIDGLTETFRPTRCRWRAGPRC